MGFVRAQIQTVEEIYRLVWTAVANKQPIDWAGIGKDGFVSSAINTAAKARADSSRQVPRQTGAVLFWRNSAR